MQYIRRFAEIGIDDIPLVGGKNASLGEMYQALTGKGVRVPDGFAITAEAWWLFLDHNNLRQRISTALDGLNFSDVEQLAEVGRSIRGWIMHADLPPQLCTEIEDAYQALQQQYGANVEVAVRSSATAEDLPDASFAGQQETYLNIHGIENLLNACRRVFASLFTNRAISYRAERGYDSMAVALSIGVQRMVRADLGAAGVMFTIDTETGFRDAVFITAAWGLGENVVQGTVNPDEYYVFKPLLGDGRRPILRKQLGDKAVKMVYDQDGAAGLSTRNIAVDPARRNRFALEDDDILTLARFGVLIEEHYSARHGRPMPMDIEWARDGITGELFIVQARPETVRSTDNPMLQTVYTLTESGRELVSGKSVGQGIAAGRARVISDPSDMASLQAGDILVTDITDPDWEPVMKIAAGIVTNRGGRTCHAAIVARELGIPAVVGCGNATLLIADGEEVTLSCADGDIGRVFQGRLAFSAEQKDWTPTQQPNTRIMLNLANPEQAFALSRLPVDGVGLARLEFIINHSIRIHPRALLQPEALDPELQQQLKQLTTAWGGGEAYFIDNLAQGVAMIAAAFYPRQVIVRLSDFKSNEYASLIGGSVFEPIEENPMIGWRGASRYYSEDFATCFRLECRALRQVRETMGLDNVAVMVPFVRTVSEGEQVLALMAEQGLRRGERGLQVYLMCEIPANALLAEDFLRHFDGFSIGSNDLTQLTLGVDRDSGLLTHFDERDPAVTRLMKMAIDACRAQGKYVGICGQAPSDFPEITRWLVQQGISSISLNPDSVPSMIREVLDMERQLAGN